MRRTPLIFIATMLAAFGAGAAWPPPPIPKNKDPSENWSLPSKDQLARFQKEDPTQAGKTRWLGDQTGDTTDSQTRPTWRLAGIVQSPAQLALIGIVGQSKQAQRIPPGSELPDGTKLTAIERDTITVQDGLCIRVFQLHRQHPISATGECNAGDTTPE